MKRILTLLFTLCSLVAFSQSINLNDVVRANTLSPTRTANALDAAIPYTATGTDTYAVTIMSGTLYSGAATYTSGDKFTITFTNANTTTTPTLNVNTEAAITITDNKGNAVAAGDVHGILTVAYDGTNFRIVGAAGGGGGTPGGSNTQVQYNNSSAFGGITGATTNGTILSVTTPATTVNTTQAASTAMVQARVLASYTLAGSNDYTVTVDGITAYATGQVFDITFPGTSNSSVVTINVNSLGAKRLYKNSNLDLRPGDLVENQSYRVVYNGTAFILEGVENIQRVYNVENFGAKHDYQSNLTASITSGTDALTCSGCAFTAADVGKAIRVFGAGGGGFDLLTTIDGFTNSTTISIATNAGTSVTTKQVEWGTDDTPAWQEAINTCHDYGSGQVYAPSGIYFFAGALDVSSNSQLYIPVTSTSETKETIHIRGEAAIMWPSAPFGAQNLPTKGVIIKSVVTGSGTLPAVWGSQTTVTSVHWENICVMVKSITGVTHVEPTMSAWVVKELGSKQFRNCIAITESDPTESAEPSLVTYGFYMSETGQTDSHSMYENITASGYYYGARFDEHDTWTRATFYNCVGGVSIGGTVTTHPVGFGSGPLNINWCKYGVVFVGSKTVELSTYFEHWPGSFSSKWYDAVADFYFPSSVTVHGRIITNIQNAGTGALQTPIITGTNLGTLTVFDMPTATMYGAGDLETFSGSGTGRNGLIVKHTDATSQATIYMDNNRGSFASYGGFLVGGSTNVGTNFGLTRADKLMIFADGASNLGFGIGTRSNQPLYFGTSDLQRGSFSAAGVFTTLVGHVIGGNTSASGYSRWAEDLDNGSNYLGFTAPASLSASLDYTLPVAPAVSGYVMASTTAGVMSWISRSGTLDKDNSQVGNVTTGEDNLYSYTLPAATLSVDENSVTGRFAGTVAANGNVKTLKLKFGGTTILTTVVTTSSITSAWTIEFECSRTGATTQKCSGKLTNGDGLGVGFNASAAETLSGTVAIVLTGEATATNDIVKEMATVKFED